MDPTNSFWCHSSFWDSPMQLNGLVLLIRIKSGEQGISGFSVPEGLVESFASPKVLRLHQAWGHGKTRNARWTDFILFLKCLKTWINKFKVPYRKNSGTLLSLLWRLSIVGHVKRTYSVPWATRPWITVCVSVHCTHWEQCIFRRVEDRTAGLSFRFEARSAALYL